MKLFAALFIISCFSTLLYSQSRYERKALLDAKEMAFNYNQKNFPKYVDYLLPSEYDNDSVNKRGLTRLFSQNSDTGKLEVLKLLKLKTVNGEKQAVLLDRFHQKNGYIIGVLDNKSKQWHFTQPMSQDVQFDLLLSMVPSLDTAFAALIDPKYGKRIQFKENQAAPAFRFTDIKGNSLSSDSLIGKVLVFNFWSISCGPCIKEMPQLNELVKAMKGKDVVFIAPALYSPGAYLVEKFLPKYPFAYQVVEITNPDDYNIFVFPTHVVTDRNHNIIYKVANGNPDNVGQLSQVIVNALGK